MAHAFRFPTRSKSNVLIYSEEDTGSCNMNPRSQTFDISERDERCVGTLYMVILTCSAGGYAVPIRFYNHGMLTL
jgi:hypothetical protein